MANYFGAKNVGEARQFLAGLAEFRPVKPLTEYKDAQVVRKANSFRQQLQAGFVPSNAIARGLHNEKASVQQHKEYQRAQAVAKFKQTPISQRGGLKKPLRFVTDIQGRAGVNAALWKLSGVGKRHNPSIRIKVGYKTKDGMWHTVGKRGGVSQRYVRDKLAAAHGDVGLMVSMMAAETGDGDDSGLSAEVYNLTGDYEFYSVL